MFQELLVAAKPRFSDDAAPERLRVVSAFHSNTSSSRSTPTWARFCWIASFIVSGYIWPEPLVEIDTLSLSRLLGP